jgi:hypothetical protein
MAAPALFSPEDKDLATFNRPDDLPRTCSDAELIEAVKEYLCGANNEEVGALLHVEPATVKQWVGSRGWRTVEALLRDQVREVSLSALSRITHKSFVQLQDRIDTGEPMYNWEGQLVGYKPIKAKDLAIIASTLVDKQHEVERRMKGELPDSTKVDLNKLARALENYARMKVVNGEVIDAADAA